MLTTDIIKQHLVLDHDEDDQLIKAYWDAAIDYCEGLIAGPIILGQRTENFSALASPLVLGPRVSSVESVTYTDIDGEQQTLDPLLYAIRYTAAGWRIEAAGTWPVGTNATVTYTAGYGNVPSAVDHAILMTIAHLYANRESTTPVKLDEVPLAVRSLLMPHARVFL